MKSENTPLKARFAIALALTVAVAGCAIQSPQLVPAQPEAAGRAEPKAQLEQMLQSQRPESLKGQPELVVPDARAYDPDYIGLLPKGVTEADRLWQQKYDPDYIGLLPKGVTEADRLWQQKYDPDFIGLQPK